MRWITELLQHLSISRSAIVALSFTCLALHFGPRFLPDHFTPLPEQWSQLNMAIGIISGIIVFIWSATLLIKLIKDTIYFLWSGIFSLFLTKDEISLLLVIAETPLESFDLNTLKMCNTDLTRLGAERLSRSLQKKGLVYIYPLAPQILNLTNKGRKRSFRYQRYQKRK